MSDAAGRVRLVAGAHTAPRPIHPFAPRCISAREAARLHGFPDWFAFYPSKWHAYRQIGNAVCPPVAWAVGRAVLAALGIAAKRPTAAVALGDDFPLPAGRQRGGRRVTKADNFPPVVARLVAGAFDATGRLRRKRFAFADVRAAIAASGAELPTVRADTFVAELARCRHPNRVLKACLDRGFTIRPVADGDAIGEFVAVGTPGARRAVPG